MVDSDKISEILEKQLKALGQPIRIDILKKLNHFDKPLSFTMLQKEVFRTNQNSANFSFHLKSLRKIEFISLLDEGYSITSIGKTILNTIIAMEQVINDRNKTVRIRTSKYSKEPFNIQKVVDFLVKEGDMEQFLANKIAQEVQQRLSKANIGYLTAPLIREYINAVLLENGLEEVRHKLTRLGSPPFEVSKLFNDTTIDPNAFIRKLGSEVSEQYLLLNLLPKKLADMYLSGEVMLLNLNKWSLRPLSLYIDSESILKVNSPKTYQDCVAAVLKYFNVLIKLSPNLTQDVLIGGFNKEFLSNLNSLKPEKLTHLIEIVASQIIKYNYYFGDNRTHLSLDFSYDKEDNVNNKDCSQIQLDRLFFEQLNKSSSMNENLLTPAIFLDYSKFNNFNLGDPLFKSIFSSKLTNNIIFFNNEDSNLMNSSNITVKKSQNNNNQVILDKILINLHMIATQAGRNDNKFYDILQEKIDSVIQFFNYKEKLVNRKLSSSRSWKFLVSDVFKHKGNNLLEDSVKSISFFGLNEAIRHHCGIELDRVEKSTSFAIKTLTFLNKIIKERNELDNVNYILSQPHDGTYLKNGYSSDIIRKDTGLTLEKQILLFKKFEPILDGGSLFKRDWSQNKTNLEEINLLLKSKLNAFSINP